MKATDIKPGMRIYLQLFHDCYTVKDIVEINDKFIRFTVEERSGIIGVSIHMNVKQMMKPCINVRIAE
jgi:hypothetical protein